MDWSLPFRFVVGCGTDLRLFAYIGRSIGLVLVADSVVYWLSHPGVSCFWNYRPELETFACILLVFISLCLA